ncbi:MAG: hydrogenase expression/formation protein HypE [Gammaproteobacteria bacterium]|nr:hydrogenase expression/formation protein HypE [Gammaproteobacteria bacterium]
MSTPAPFEKDRPTGIRRRGGKVRDQRITLSHGSGGKAMRDLIDDVFVGSFDNPSLAMLEDQARFSLAELLAHGDRLAFTTDSYVVDPLFFPGGDIGTLAVNGTVNDLAVSGAKPLFLSCAMILEEGLDVDVLRKVAHSMRDAAKAAGVTIVTGDTKVVPRGKADKLFINTAGIGVIPKHVEIAANQARPGDAIIVNGLIGDHGAAILNARGDLALDTDLESDCQPLNGLIDALLAACPEIHSLRDATRGGVATVLNEFAQAACVSMHIIETALPIREEVKGVCEILGLDPLYMANEGKLVAIVPGAHAQTALEAMRAHPAGRDAAIIGEVSAAPEGVVTMATVFGGERIVDMLVGEQLPRIC